MLPDAQAVLLVLAPQDYVCTNALQDFSRTKLHSCVRRDAHPHGQVTQLQKDASRNAQQVTLQTLIAHYAFKIALLPYSEIKEL